MAGSADHAGFIALAGEVEQWFGPMIDDPEFQETLDKNIRRGSALCVRGGDDQVLGGLLLSARPSRYRIGWLVVAGDFRGRGVGRALVAESIKRMVPPVSILEVLTFGAEHPAAVPSGARPTTRGWDSSRARSSKVPGRTARVSGSGGIGCHTVANYGDSSSAESWDGSSCRMVAWSADVLRG